MTTDTQYFAHLRAFAVATHKCAKEDYASTMKNYHSAANPAIVIALLDKLEALQDELAQLNGYVQKANADVTEACVERDAALARLAELEKSIADKGGDEHSPTQWAYDQACAALASAKAAGASPEPSALQAENDKLITALAACRDAFPVPDAGSRLDDWYCSAMADPLEVPEYVGMCVAGASPVEPAKDHEIAALVNQLTSIAKEFHAHQSLRERVAQLVRPWAQPSQADAQRYRLLRSCRGMEHDPLLTVVHEIDGVLWGADLDDAVDAAINAKGAQ